MDHDIQSDTARSFVAALHELEQSGDTTPISELLTADAAVLSIDGAGQRTGPAGISELFTTYRAQFDRVSTTFTQVTESDRSAALEWRTTATGLDGRSLEYTGITVIDIDGDAISGFRTCYDSAALLRGEPAPQEGSESEGGEDDTATSGHTGADSGFIDAADREASDGTTP